MKTSQHKSMVVFGTGGHAQVIADCILMQHGKYEFIGFVDPFSGQDMVMGYPVFKDIRTINIGTQIYGIVGVGANYLREKIALEVNDHNLPHFTWDSVVHPSAIISPRANVGNGCFINAGVIINNNASIGDHVSLNTATVVEHDCTIAAFASTGPRVAMGGACQIGERCYIGLGANISHGRNITDDCVLGAGSLLVSDCHTPCEIFYGAPAKFIRKRQKTEGYL